MIKSFCMKKVRKILTFLFFLVILLPTVQSTYVFKDIKNIDQGIIEINSRLETIKSSMDNLGSAINESNSIMEEVQQSVVLLEETNKEINNMSEKLKEVSIIASEALDIADNVDVYMDDIITILWAGICAIILAILTFIGVTIVILKRKK
jgi:uncharacterized protein YoxC